MSDTVNQKPSKRLYIVTYGWPMVTVARDGAGSVKEGKWFGVSGLGKKRAMAGNFSNVA